MRVDFGWNPAAGWSPLLRIAIVALLLLSACSGESEAGSSPDPIRVLMITGADGHPWEANKALMRDHLGAWNAFDIEEKIVGGPDEWLEWEGEYGDYDVVAVMYYQPTAAEAALESLDAWVRGGGGLVAIHSGIAGFDDQEIFDRMVGMGWRGAGYGRSLMISPEGEPIVREPGEGGGAAHPRVQEFPVRVIDDSHPITARLPHRVWMQTEDELYYNLRGPVEGMRVLAVANRDVPSGEYAPQLWVRDHGEGRVFVTTLGHFEPSVNSVGFMTTLALGLEWAATGHTTLPIPANFPDEEESRSGSPRFDP